MGSCGSALNIDNENNMIILQVIILKYTRVFFSSVGLQTSQVKSIGSELKIVDLSYLSKYFSLLFPL